MNKQLHSLLALIIIATPFCFTSCADNDGIADINKYNTTFSVYECNVGFSLQKAASSRFVSEYVIITIWEPIYDAELKTYNYSPISKLKTGIDGSVTYSHDNQYIYYSVEREENEDKSNLATIKVKDQDLIKTITLQIYGVFTSDEDISAHAKINIDPTLTNYAPHIGALKFKDINKDGLIDEKDAVSMAEINAFDTRNPVIYIASKKQTARL